MRLSVDDISAMPVTQSSFILHFLSPTSRVHNRATLDIKMSFGFSVGDFLEAIRLANKMRKEFANAPSQFKAISDEYVI